MARSQFSESLSLLSGARVSVQDFVMQGREIEADGENMGLQTEGEYGNVEMDKWTPGANAENPKLTYTFKNESNNNLAGKVVNYEYDLTDGTWECTTSVKQEFANNCGEVGEGDDAGDTT
ncbi:pilin [Salinicola halophyticus]|uniref:pilin n=1 Tax=Salinicola halophyticus TaxID=1808881 RepID=UPI003F44A3E8